MENSFLIPVFERIFERKFNPKNNEDRKDLKNAVYLLCRMGINVGNYSFAWFRDRIISISLQGDIDRITGEESVSLNFSPDAMDSINTIKAILEERPPDYDEHHWLDCIARACYQQGIMPSGLRSTDPLLDRLANTIHSLDSSGLI